MNLPTTNALHTTVTSRLFTHIVFTEKMRKDLRDRKDSRGTNYNYYISCFLILLLLKVDRDFSTFNNLFTLFINMKTKDKTICSIHIIKKKV